MLHIVKDKSGFRRQKTGLVSTSNIKFRRFLQVDRPVKDKRNVKTDIYIKDEPEENSTKIQPQSVRALSNAEVYTKPLTESLMSSSEQNNLLSCESALASHCNKSCHTFSEEKHQRIFDIGNYSKGDNTSVNLIKCVSSIRDISDICLKHRIVQQNKKVVDLNHSEIYTTLSTRNMCQSSDIINACLFCGEIVPAIYSHFVSKHHEEFLIQELMRLKDYGNWLQIKEKRLLFISGLLTTLLINRGNDLHNSAVLKLKMGELILNQDFKKSLFNCDDFVTCSLCYLWYDTSQEIHSNYMCMMNNDSYFYMENSVPMSFIDLCLNGEFQSFNYNEYFYDTSIDIDSSFSDKLYFRSVPHDIRITDEEFKDVFIVSFKNGTIPASDSVHACVVCCKLYTDIILHVKEAHTNYNIVRTLLKQELLLTNIDQNNQITKVTFIIEHLKRLIRNAGNDKHNLKVLKRKKGEILGSQCETEQSFRKCSHCLIWLDCTKGHHIEVGCISEEYKLKNSLSINIKSEEQDSETRQTNDQSNENRVKRNLLPIKVEDDLMSQIRDSSLKEIANNDELIKKVGYNSMKSLPKINMTTLVNRSKSTITMMAKYLMKLRELGRFYDDIRHDFSIVDLKTFLQPKYVDLLSEAALRWNISLGLDEELSKEHLKSNVTRAKKIISKITNLLDEDIELFCDRKYLQNILRKQWNSKISFFEILSNLVTVTPTIKSLQNNIWTLCQAVQNFLRMQRFHETETEFENVKAFTLTRLLMVNNRVGKDIEQLQ